MAPLSARTLGAGAATGGRAAAVRAGARAAFGGARGAAPLLPGLAAPRADGCSSSSALACVAPGPDDYSFATVEPRPTGRRNRGFDKKEGAAAAHRPFAAALARSPDGPPPLQRRLRCFAQLERRRRRRRAAGTLRL